MGNESPQSQWPPPHWPRLLCWQTPRPVVCASCGVSFVIGSPNAFASSAIHLAQFSSMTGCLFHSAVLQAANAHNSAETATGFAFPCVQALFGRLTYSPTTFGVSSIPTCDDTPDELLAK